MVSIHLKNSSTKIRTDLKLSCVIEEQRGLLFSGRSFQKAFDVQTLLLQQRYTIPTNCMSFKNTYTYGPLSSILKFCFYQALGKAMFTDLSP